MTSAEAKKIAEAKEAAVRAQNARKPRELSEDELRIKAYAEKNKDMVDEQGRRMF